jgi:hypothetical protein
MSQNGDDSSIYDSDDENTRSFNDLETEILAPEAEDLGESDDDDDDEEEEEEDDDEEDDEEDDDEVTESKVTSTNDLRQKQKLNKFEYAAIIGLRAKQLEGGAPTLLPESKIQEMMEDGITSCKDIAKIEFQLMVPHNSTLKIIRKMPNGTKQVIRASVGTNVDT